MYSWLSLIRVVNTLSTRGVFNPKPITYDQHKVTPPHSLNTITDVVHIGNSLHPQRFDLKSNFHDESLEILDCTPLWHLYKHPSSPMRIWACSLALAVLVGVATDWVILIAGGAEVPQTKKQVMLRPTSFVNCVRKKSLYPNSFFSQSYNVNLWGRC